MIVNEENQFSVKEYVCSIFIATFAMLVPAKPLNNAQIGGAFYFFSIFDK